MAEEPEVKPRNRLQNVRDFTVQIRHAETDEIVGTGIAISMDGEIVTCKHVFEGAVITPAEDIEKGEVGVYFPRAKGVKKDRRAKLARYFSDSDDDVVVLQVIGKPPPLAPEQIAILSDAERSEGNPFRSYGYCPLGAHVASRASGEIMGDVEHTNDEKLQADPISLKSGEIDRGMSGAAVLDTKRNLVVGIIAETYYPKNVSKHSQIGWAVDANVLTFDPLKVPIYEGESLELKKSAKPRYEVMSQAEESIGQNLSLTEHPAPIPPWEWVGREELLDQLNLDWNDADTKVVGLIGFGGEGKSSLASRWITDLLQNKDQKQLDGLFWWSFYDRRSTDEFFEAALTYLSGKDKDLLMRCKSPNARAHLIAGMLYSGDYLFVLDGLEVMQKQEGDDYGEFGSDDLREFLEYFSAAGHSSFCLITSRAPVFDLMNHTTFKHRDVTRLSDNEGCSLLEKVGVKGGEPDLKKAVELWDGHALTLSLIGAYLAKVHNGDIAHLSDIKPPTTDEKRYERVHRILRRYDKHLTDDERAFLLLFSAFRTPVAKTAFDKVFRSKTTEDALNAPIAALSDAEFETLLDRLQTYRILRHDPQEKQYTTHPLIRAHYLTLLSRRDSGQTQKTHEQIKDYYLSVAGDLPNYPTLDDLIPLIEVVHHACQAGAYDEAYCILSDRIYRGSRFVLPNELGAWETDRTLLSEFFPEGDTSQEPQTNEPGAKSLVLNEVGLCLMCLGRLSEAVPLYGRGAQMAKELGNLSNASAAYQNLADLYAYLGRLAESAQAATEALQLAHRAEHKLGERNSLGYQARAAHLCGDLETADTAFQQAEALEREIDPDKRYLYSNRGIFHGDNLRRVGKADCARKVTEANLEICERNHWAFQISMCHRVLGDLAADAGDNERARRHYEAALKIARSITLQHVLIEVLLARGRWQAKQAVKTSEHATLQQAFSDLNEALGYADKGGFRIYEADIRVALAWAHLANTEPEAARQEASRALAMSEEMGYYWGKLDA
ncbi:MAG: tetratricopeptide repeat protein, partial [candidate division Zixibacteria bacterium]|nr:tetratricopeptide repeat protein [candidate division Zixibacteria bacterium]